MPQLETKINLKFIQTILNNEKLNDSDKVEIIKEVVDEFLEKPKKED